MTFKHIVILTGAGLSIESGIAPFRGPGGIWTQSLINDIATPEGFHANPERAHAHYNDARAMMLKASPNAAHLALAKLAAEYPGKVTIITQNVDDLHSRAQQEYPPSERARLYYMHGELLKARKMKPGEQRYWDETGAVVDCREPITADSPHVMDGRLRSLRPDTVLFGEEVKHHQEVIDAINECDAYVAVGTSGHVPPANMFAYFVKEGHERTQPPGHTIEINPYPTGDSHFDTVHAAPATEAVPALVEQWLKEAKKELWTKRTAERTGRAID